MTDPDTWKGPDLKRVEARLVCALAWLVTLVFWLIASAGGAPGFPLDDAWIHLVYARALATDFTFSYNPGFPTTGCTAPLWAMLLGMLHLVLSGKALIWAVQLLGAILHTVAAWGTAALACRVSNDRRVGIAAGILSAFSIPLCAGALAGMEVPLCAALLVWAVHDAVAGRWRRCGVWLALAAAARPEAAVVSVVVFAAMACQLRADRPALVRAALALVLPSVLVAGLLIGHNLAVSGHALPATFYAKNASNFASLPKRLGVALSGIFSQIPPFIGWIGWLALAGYFLQRASAKLLLPVLAGIAFLLANLYVMPPADPKAFYHVRYILPGIPLLIAALAVGTCLIGNRLPANRRMWPVVFLVLIGVLSGLMLLVPRAKHFANDVRNINEVQVAMGRWLAEHVEEGHWIAASDAGAVRYFSNRPTIDVLGLNTPEMLSDPEGYTEAHPVAAFALMANWFRPVSGDVLQPYGIFQTENYTVTSAPGMAVQAVLGRAAPVENDRVGFQMMIFDKRTISLRVVPEGMKAKPLE